MLRPMGSNIFVSLTLCKEAGIIIYLWRSSRSLESYCVNYQLVGGARALLSC